ncbi:peptidoglycan-binding LysM [Pseudomonas sp. M47T1]|uniref:LysM peptidoglycan-binding domain-containing protein n=1 Tax=unclassified Pseudomonas TaxID=196821 RepID=UPI0002608584|nr:LysM domain-containing protein [Pseudomonas sp. M47T1]EIK97529.1 peptidoglycan-binding LysM [Pseudomonas sp. M47T1]
MRKSLLALLLMACAGLASADVQLKDGYPQRYTVVQGDTLWDISAKFLREPWQWPQIWHANPQIANPDLIYPGDSLVLSYVNGQPQLMLERGASRGTIKLSPRIRSTPVAEAIPIIPLQSINAFLLSNRILDSTDAFNSAPYIVAGQGERVVSGMGDRIYARGTFDPAHASYGIFRQGKVYTDPVTHEQLGVNADNMGGGEIVATEGDIATLNLQRSSEEVRLGDRLFVSEERPVNSTFLPSAPAKSISGTIIDVPRGVTQIGKYDVVTLDRGNRDGLKEGNVLAIYKTGETVRDRVTGEQVKIPDERAGLLMVFRTYQKLSYGLVLNANRSLAVLDKVKNP